MSLEVAVERPLDPVELARRIGVAAAPHAARHDQESSFVSEGYAAVRRLRYGEIAIPIELGGGGATLREICQAQRILGRACGSTSLAIAMHQHTVLSFAWRWGQHGEDDVDRLLRRVVDEELLLSSSGTLDPAHISIEAASTEGGLILNGSKRLASGAPGADMLLAVVGDGSKGWMANVMVPLAAGGVDIVDDWHAMGMRGSGSNTVKLNDVFVSEENVFLKRDRPVPRATGVNIPRPFVGLQTPGLMFALPVIAASYLGVAEAVHDAAIEQASSIRRGRDPHTHRLAGLMHHELRLALASLESMIAEVETAGPNTRTTWRTVMLAKRQVVLSSIATVEAAMEMLGSATYLTGHPFERALRDTRAGITHPLPPEATISEVGRMLLLDRRSGRATDESG